METIGNRIAKEGVLTLSQLPHDPTNLIIEQIRSCIDSADSEERLRELLAGIRAEDIADILDDFDPTETLKVFAAIGTEAQAEVIDETDATSREQVLENLDLNRLKQILEEMPPDEATDLLNELPQGQRREVLAEMDPATTVELLRLMQHPPHSAGGIMTLDYIAINPQLTAEESLSRIQEDIDTEVVNYVYVIDKNRHLIGVISIRDLLGATPQQTVSEMMTAEVISVRVDEDREDVANLARKYNLQAIPVVDEHEHLLGVATIDDIVEILSDEADEDIYRLAGAPESHPAQQKILKRALVRIPWLLLPVLSGFILAWMHPGELDFDQILNSTADQRLLLAAFIPLVMGIAGGVGTQSATVVVRGMAVGDIELGRSTFRLFRQEVVVGLLIAIAIGAIVGAVLFIATGLQITDQFLRLPLAVATGIGAGIIFANACGTALPILCERIGLDSALVAGPFITSFNDVTAAIIFMAVAEVMLRSI
ncbi:MAG: magnesium transporter [Planctomycetota bacterium]|nr:magnesium transporter [Planctomycetota bacterium]